jgi:hypothetical protein
MSIAASSGKYPSLEHDTVRTSHLKSITVGSRLARLGVESTVEAVKRHEFPQISEQWWLFHH